MITDHGRTPDTLAQGVPGGGVVGTRRRRGWRRAPRPGRSPRRPPRPPGASPRTPHSLSANTRAAYRCALRQFDTWRGAAPATDATLAAYLGWLFEQGRAPATAALGVAAVTFRATLAGTPVRGPQTDRRPDSVAVPSAAHHHPLSSY